MLNEPNFLQQQQKTTFTRHTPSNDLVKGSPVSFFISFLIIMATLAITIYVRSSSASLSSISKTDNQVNKGKDNENLNTYKSEENKWFEIVIPSEGKRFENNAFKYPEIFDNINLSSNKNILKRNNFQAEFSRFLGMDPYSDDFGDPHVLVVGSNSAIGSAVVSELTSHYGQKVIPIRDYIHVDFSAPSVKKLFQGVQLSGAIVIHQPPLFRYATTDGYEFINELIYNYTDGLMTNILQPQNINVVYAVTPPYFEGNTNVDYCYGAKLVFLPHIIDNKEKYDTENLMLRTVRECKRIKKSKIFRFKGNDQIIESITAEEAAIFLIDQLFNNFQPGRVTPKGSTNITLEKALKIALNEEKECNVTFSELPHNLKEVSPSKNEIIIGRNEISSLIENTFSSYEENKNGDNKNEPYLSIVITGRNDHFAEGFENRFQVFIDKLSLTIEKIPTSDIELVFVDYSTDYPKNDYLCNVMKWPKNLIKITRNIIVPQSFHKEIATRLKTKTPFMEYLAKNIGSYRSRGEFILTMNPDSILSSSFLECVSSRNLNEGVLYQATRFPLNEDILRSNTVDEIYQLTEEPWTHKKYNLQDFIEDGRRKFRMYSDIAEFDYYLNRAGAGDFLLMSRKLWDAVNGFHEVGYNTMVDNMLTLKLLKLVTGFARMYLPYAIVHQEHPHISPMFGSVEDYLGLFYQTLMHGKSNLINGSSDRSDWGYRNVFFEERKINVN